MTIPLECLYFAGGALFMLVFIGGLIVIGVRAQRRKVGKR